MSAVAARKKRGPEEEHENHERWLLTYSDMITLLLALFIVLYSISSVNISKFETLQQSLKSAFSGSILTGGKSIMQSGSTSSANHSPQQADVPSIVPLTPTIPHPGSTATVSKAEVQALVKEAQNSSAEQSEFQSLQNRLNSYSKAHGWTNQVKAVITQRGLVITVLTDKLLFASGQDTLQAVGLPVMNEVATLINLDSDQHPVVVEGYTDNEPIDTAEFPSNWQLSTGRATSVIQYLQSRGVPESRLSAAGYADQFPVASNASAAGRALNRRVEIVFERKYPQPSPGA
jgi:chemotaxis protein MotB